jgi:hypothetical protein
MTSASNPQASTSVPDATPAKSKNHKKDADMRAPLNTDEISKMQAAHPLATTRSEHLGSLLVLLWGLFVKSKDSSYLRAMMDEIEQAGPDLKYGPHTTNAGTDAFMDFSEELSNDDARKTGEELKVCFGLLLTKYLDNISHTC